MKNKFNFLIFSLIFSTLANASETPLWIGLKGGYGSGRAHVKRHLTEAIPGYQHINDSSHMDIQGLNAGPFIEIGHIFSRQYYAGLQFNSLFSNVKGSLNTHVNNPDISLRNRVRLKQSYGGDLRLGLFHKDILFFVKGGLTNGRWQMETNGLPMMGRSKVKKNLNGASVGIGLSVPFKSFSLGGEITHTWFKKSSYPLLDRQGKNIMNSYVQPKYLEIHLHIKFKTSTLLS